jgi:hypothetical protein
VDLHARAWRQLAALRHPADLMVDNSSGRADKWHLPLIRSCPAGEYRAALPRRAGGRLSRIRLLTGWSLVRIRPGEPNKSGV